MLPLLYSKISLCLSSCLAVPAQNSTKLEYERHICTLTYMHTLSNPSYEVEATKSSVYRNRWAQRITILAKLELGSSRNKSSRR